MNVLVLGGSGFIGSHVVQSLIAGGDSVVVYGRNTNIGHIPMVNVKYIDGSLSDTVQLSIALNDIDVVVHLISSTIPATSNADPQYDINQNLIHSVGLLQLMKEKAVGRIVYLSSGGAIYGNNVESPISELHNNFPVCSYGIVKLAFEKYLYMYQQLYGIEYVSIRASNPYGPRQSHLGVQGVVGTMLYKAMIGEDIEIWGDGTVVRDFIYVNDLAEFAVKCVDSSITGCFNAGSGKGTSIIELTELVEKVSGIKLQKKFSKERRFDVRDNVLDIEKARESFEWTPGTPLDIGLLLTWEWLLEYQNNDSIYRTAA